MKTNKWIFLSIIVLAFSMLACNLSSFGKPKATPTPHVLVATDNNSQITVPEGWETTDKLNKVADLQVIDSKNDIYAIVITEDRENFTSFDKYAEICYDQFINLVTDPDVTGPNSVTINGSPAMQYKITGSVKELNITYLYTLIEGTANYHQVLMWTTKSNASKAMPVMQSITESFQDLSK